MGTLRWEKEAEVAAREQQRREEFARKRRALESAEADIAARIAALQLDLERQRAELAHYTHDGEARQISSGARNKKLRRLRSAEPTPATTPVSGQRRAARAAPGAGRNGNGGREQRRGP